MRKHNPNTSETLMALQDTFAEQLSDRMDEIDLLWREILDKENVEESLSDFHIKIHSLVGSAGTFGAMSISNAAKHLEDKIKKSIEEHSVSKSQLAVLQSSYKRLQEAVASWCPGCGLHILPPKLNNYKYTQHFNNLIYLVNDDPLISGELADLFESLEYRVVCFHSLNTFLQSCNQAEKPGAIIIDLAFEEGDVAGADAIQKLRQECKEFPVVVFISERDDIQARLATVRAGANRYFTKPLDYKKLSQSLDGLTGRLVKAPYRVLIVDDDQAVMGLHANILDQAGINVKTLSDPLAALSLMDEFEPELILLDVCMPECSGFELASMIRQDDKWAQTPIVFLSSELDIGRQLVAMNLGGDDFIAKPVEGEYLVESVIARLKRSRWVRRLNNELDDALKESEYQRIALDQHSIVSVTNTNGIITFVNDKFCDVTGYSREEVLGNTHSLINSGVHPVEFFDDMWKTISQGRVWHGDNCNCKKNGEIFWVETTIVPFLDNDGKPYQYVAVRTDITSVMKTQAELIKAKEDAENSSKAKSQFLSSMSHELRTPLNAVLGFSQILTHDPEAPLTDLQLESVMEIEKAGKHLLNLINEVLDLAKIESGRIDMNIEFVSLAVLFRECEAMILPLLSKYNVTLEYVQGDVSSFYVRADSVRLKQVVLNLLTNACKYNKPDGKVLISCHKTNNGNIRITISDTGRGIPPERLNELFEPFNRLGAESSKIEGTGIGLVISKQLIDLMGGEIGVNNNPGEGCSFWVELPQDIPLHASSVSQKDDELNMMAEEHRLIKVLYIEDNPVNLRLVSKMLGSRPYYKLSNAHEPWLGLDLAESHQPDLILLDVRLPTMDGYKVLRKLKNNKKTDSIPVVAISANAMPEDIKKAEDAGFDGYITKPIEVNSFYSVIDKVLASRSDNIDSSAP